MGRDFHQAFAVARDTFSEASEALHLDLRALCFDDDPRLNLTEYTQPAILTVEIAMFRALEAEFGLRAQRFGGHSLGEYSALCAAGVLPLGEAVRLVRARGALMQRAAPVGSGCMVAVSGSKVGEGERLRALQALPVDVANHNSPNQVVLSGSRPDMQRARQRLAERLADLPHELVDLNVSAPFHSRWMQPVVEPLEACLQEALANADTAPATRVTSNLTGALHEPARAALVEALAAQASRTLCWVANMQVLGACARIFEVGPGRPLRSFFRAVGRDVVSIVSLASAERAGLAA